MVSLGGDGYLTSSSSSHGVGHIFPRSDECWATSLDWFLLISSFLLLSLLWWVHEIPTLFLYDLGTGVSKFMERTAWHSLRMHVPSALGIYALGRSPDPARWPASYYFPSTSDEGKPLTLLKGLRVLIPDTLILVGTCLGSYRLGTFESLRYFQSLNVHLWLLPQLPSVLIGYCILAASYTGIRNRIIVIIFIYTVLLLVGIAFALAAYLQLKGYGEGSADKISVSMVLIGVQYGIMIIPWTLLTCCLPVLLIFFYVILCMIARILSFAMDMQLGPFASPFCGLNAKTLSYAVISFGVLAWLIGSGAAIYCHRHHAQLWGWGQETGTSNFVPLNETVGNDDNTPICQKPNGVPDPKIPNDD